MPQHGSLRQSQISAFEVGLLLAGMPAIANHALAVTYILQAGGRDAWLGGLLGIPGAVASVFALIALSRRFPGESLVQYLPRVVGMPLGRLLGVLYILFFLAGAAFTVRRTTDFLVDSFIPETPAMVIAITYLIACLYAAAGGIEILARVTGYLLPLLTLSGIFALLGTMPTKDYGLLLPMLEHGFGPVLHAAWLANGILGELCVAGMFLQYVGDRKHLLRASLAGTLFAAGTMVGPISGSIASWGVLQAGNMPYPTYRQWLLMSFARFLERTDLLVVHQWLGGAYFRTGVLLWAGTVGTLQLVRTGSVRMLLLGVGLLVLFGAMAVFPNMLLFDRFITTVYLPAGLVLGMVMPVLLWGVAAVRGLATGGGGAHAGQS